MYPVVVVQARGLSLPWTAFRGVMTRFAFAAPSSQARRQQRARIKAGGSSVPTRDMMARADAGFNAGPPRTIQVQGVGTSVIAQWVRFGE